MMTQRTDKDIQSMAHSPPQITTIAGPTLPHPQELPAADVVIYDGNCQFCRRQVDRLHRYGGNKLAFISLHDPDVKRYAPNLSHEQLMNQMYIVDASGRQFGGAAAFRYLSRKLPALWPVAPFLHIPLALPIWQWLYAQVARRRYRWNRDTCDGETCRVHFK
jgi:predicted DCC family thiol-disulfide oxidoreductase YuxK